MEPKQWIKVFLYPNQLISSGKEMNDKRKSDKTAKGGIYVYGRNRKKTGKRKNEQF